MLAPLPPPSSQFASPSGNMPAQTWAQYFQSLDQTVRGLSGGTPTTGGDETSIIDIDPTFDLTGATDMASALQTAINGLTNGGTLTFPAGSVVKIGSTVSLGNGTSSAKSTIQGIALKGVGGVAIGGAFNTPTATPLRFVWSGTTGGIMFEIAGPLAGWGLGNLELDGNSSAGQALRVQSAQNGQCNYLTILNCTTDSLRLDAYTTFATAGEANTMHNTFINTTVILPNVANAVAILLTGAATGTPANSCYNTFINTTVIDQAGTASKFGLYLQGCDSNVFHSAHFVGGATASAAVTFDYSVENAWPASNYLNAFDTGGWDVQFQNSSTAPGVFARTNYVSLTETNDAVAPSLDNMLCWNNSEQILPWCVAASTGTANAIHAQFAQTFNGLPDGRLIHVRAIAANTVAAVTLQLFDHGSDAGLGTQVITKRGGTALVAGDIAAAGHELILRYNLAHTRWELLNPTT